MTDSTNNTSGGRAPVDSTETVNKYDKYQLPVVAYSKLRGYLWSNREIDIASLAMNI